jgi:two-component system sensor kinase FixL
VVAGYLGLYVALDWMSYLYPVAPFAITVWNPPPGLSLALLLLFGLSRAPWLVAAALLADFVVRGTATSPWLHLAAAGAIAGGYTLTAAILARVVRIDPALRRVRDVGWLLVGSSAGAALVALLFVGLHAAAGAVAWADFGSHALRFWIGDAIGAGLTSAFLLVLATPAAHPWPARRPHPLEVLLQLASIAASLVLIFLRSHPAESSLFYLLFLPAIWIAMRYGLRGASSMLVAVQLSLMALLWIRMNPLSTVLEFQFLMLALGVTTLLLAAVTDERAAARAELAERESELRTIFETAPEGILTLDASGRVVAANRAAEATFGVASAELVGRSLDSFLPGHVGARPSGPTELEGVRSDGSRFPAEVSVAPAGNLGLRLLLLRDIGHRREIEEQLRERQEELARALRLAAAGEMTSALAHELNQPLSAISNYVKACRLLAAEGDGARLAGALERVVEEVARASEVVRRLRDFFRTGAVHLEPVPVSELIRATLQSVRSRAERHSIALSWEDPHTSWKVLGDRVQLEVVLLNLVNNSIDAISQARSPRREVSLTASATGGWVEVRLEDTGPGVPPDVTPRLFQPFTTSKADGMGLGLAISRYVVEAHGGRLWSKERAVGAVFCFTLPLEGEPRSAA